jgi:hypothetical protein
MVYQSTQQTYDLVEKDYYAAELKYQDVIDASARAKALGGDFIVKYESDSIKLILPSPFKGVNVVGKVQLYFAADKQQDKTYEFETLNAYKAFKTEKQNKGLYTIKLDIVRSGVAYYYEQKIYL